MMIRILAIVVAFGAAWAIWYSYGQLRIFRGTPFWDYRYVIFASSTFLSLSALEWAVGWIKSKIEGEKDAH
jgi:hypothetical protein